MYSHLDKINSADYSLDIKNARFFVIKSYTEEDVHKSMKYQIWSSTQEGNKKLNDCFLKCSLEKIPIFLFFSVNGSGQFVGACKMISEVSFKDKCPHWSQSEKWVGKFKVEWIYIKDIPNKAFKSITVPTNDYKPVSNSRDTQEIPLAEGMKVLKVFATYKHELSLLDEFETYDNKEREKKESKTVPESFGKLSVDPSRGTKRRGRGRGRGAKDSPEKNEKTEKEGPSVPQPSSNPSPNTNA